MPDEDLSQKDKDELVDLLHDLKNKIDEPKEVKGEAVKRVLLWLADKSVDALIAAFPMIAVFVQSMS
ncbi:hypothetical protein [Eggerthella sp. YY7918]|uniref:hypothetical protein n=1 Tax=Eggerthella sp. (strain YY7918) TaxID=502558 RepID=UPI00021716CA|nr:hypothetical protein [Eggerthella sp. YY7918]BAK45561.1 transcriptional regulator [Eggerthella sp. YY7918]